MTNDFDHIKAVIFDMDGVLVNSEPFYVEVEQHCFKKVNIEVAHEEHIGYQGTATDRMWRLVKQRHGLTQSIEELVQMTDEIVMPYFENLETIDPMSGVDQLIKLLASKKIPIAVASSSNADVIKIILEKTGLKKYFPVVVDSVLAGASKPEPDIFLLAAKKLNIDPAHCLVIEDSTNGITAANKAGMFCVAYAGPGSEHQDQSMANLIISDYQQLVDSFK